MFSLKKIFVSSILLFLLGSVLHFLYEFTGNNFLVGLFTPVNESVWEHLKLAYFPILLWWFFNFKKAEAPENITLLGATVSLLVAPLIVIFLFYSYTGALGTELLWFDILILFIAIFSGLLAGNHMFYVENAAKWITYTLLTLTIGLFIGFLVFTAIPPNLPIFISA